MDIPQGNFVGTAVELLVFGEHFVSSPCFYQGVTLRGYTGAYTVLFLQHMKVLSRRRSKEWSYIYLVATSIVLYILILMVSILFSILFRSILMASKAYDSGLLPSLCRIHHQHRSSQCTINDIWDFQL
jgi:hypothetical protein